MKAARARARLRIPRLRDGVTVIIVNWNTAGVTADVVRAVQHFSPEAQVLLVDNGSTDGSRDIFRSWPCIDTMLLASNAGHGPALDLAVCAARTRIAVTLDSDAIPLHTEWLEPIVEPIRSGRALLAGSRASRGFVHPIYLAIDTATFIHRRLSFQVHRQPGLEDADVEWGVNAWDTAELMTPRVSQTEVVFVDRTPNIVEGLPGMTAGAAVYHHGGVTRAVNSGVTDEAFRGWRVACAAHGLTFLESAPPGKVSSPDWHRASG